MLGNLQILQALIERGADINIQDAQGYSPLDDAIRFSRLNIIVYLLSHNADVNIQDNRGHTPLHRAAASRNDNNVDIVNLLLIAGANVDTQDDSGDTALHIAVERDNPRIVEALLSAGTTTTIENNEHLTVNQLLLIQELENAQTDQNANNRYRLMRQGAQRYRNNSNYPTFTQPRV